MVTTQSGENRGMCCVGTAYWLLPEPGADLASCFAGMLQTAKCHVTERRALLLSISDHRRALCFAVKTSDQGRRSAGRPAKLTNEYTGVFGRSVDHAWQVYCVDTMTAGTRGVRGCSCGTEPQPVERAELVRRLAGAGRGRPLGLPRTIPERRLLAALGFARTVR
jgi:hypothetical protein